MKKVLRFLLSFPLVVVVACSSNADDLATSSVSGASNNDSGINTSSYIKGSYSEYVKDVKELNNLTNNQLLDIYFNVEKYPEQYMNLVNYRIEFAINSSSSEEEANAYAEERVHDERYSFAYDIPTGSDVVFQNDYYYIVHVTWDYYSSGKKTEYEGYTLSYKDTYVDFVAPVYHLDIDFSMTIKDLSRLQTIVDIYECIDIMGKFIISNAKETEDKYIYCSYYFKTIVGDWGLDSEVQLIKRTYEIAKASGIVSYIGEEMLQNAFYH